MSVLCTYTHGLTHSGSSLASWVLSAVMWVKELDLKQSCHFACLSVFGKACKCVWGFSLNKQVPKSVPITPIKWCSHQHLWVPGPQEPAGLSERIWLWGTLTQPVIHEAGTHMRSLNSAGIISYKFWRNSSLVFITEDVLDSIDQNFVCKIGLFKYSIMTY